MYRFFAVLVPSLVLSLGACAGTAEITYRAPVTTSAMVEVRPGVYAVTDQDEPVFFADNFYWRYHDNTWYRTRDTGGNWIRIGRPPEVVLQIREPYRYRRYRASARDTVVIRDREGRLHRR